MSVLRNGMSKAPVSINIIQTVTVKLVIIISAIMFKYKVGMKYKIINTGRTSN